MKASKRTSHCNKKPYDTLLAAQIATKRTVTDKKRKGNPILTHMSAYKCRYCDKFHVGRDRIRGIDWNAFAAYEKKVQDRIKNYKETA